MPQFLKGSSPSIGVVTYRLIYSLTYRLINRGDTASVPLVATHA